MIKNLKKAFTIIELVIVIAVIAILAAVMIPTYSSLVEKANLSADEQAVQQMNTALAIYTAENGKPENAGQVKVGLSENDINADTLVPVTQGYAFYWNPTENKIVLVGEGKSTAKKGWVLLTSTGYGVAPNETVTNVETLKKAITQSRSESTVLVKLEQDIVAPSTSDVTAPYDDDRKGIFCVGKNETLIIDANGYTFNSEVNYNLFRVDDGGQLVVKNAIIDTKFCAFMNSNGILRLENVTIKNTGRKACVHIAGISDTYISNSKLTSSVSYCIATNSSKDENDGSRLTLISSDLTSTANTYAAINITTYANVTIEGGTFSGTQTGAYFRGCNATIKNATFIHSSNDGDEWGTGCHGDAADLVFACGGIGFLDYTKTSNYACDNVTASLVIVHEPKDGSVNVSGISLNKEYRQWIKNN